MCQNMEETKSLKEPDKDVGEEKDHDVQLGKCCPCNIGQYIKDNLLLILTLCAVICGFCLGFGIRETHPSKDALLWIGMPGELFLRMLKLMILPLIVCSVISGTASLDPKSNGKISGIAFIYIVATNLLGCLIGVTLSLIIKPGIGAHSSEIRTVTNMMQTQDIFADLLRNIFPDNMVEATFSQAQTKYSRKDAVIQRNDTNGTIYENVTTYTKSVGKTGGTNVLGLIMACTVIGIAAGKMGSKAKVFLDFFTVTTDIILHVLRWFLWLTPFGVMSLIAVAIAAVDDTGGVFTKLGLFVLAVTIGILLHQLLLLPMILFFTTRRNPYAYILSVAKAWMIGFAATSTAVAIPEMLMSCEVKNKIDKRVSRFVIPFCVTLNADGSALYITSAAIFIGNISGIGVSSGDIVIIVILTTIASMALPSVPSSSIVTLVMILTSLNIPADDIALLFAVEWFLDRIRTTSNIVSHTFCAAVTFQFCKTDMKKLDADSNTSATELGDLEIVISPKIKALTDED